MLGFLQLHAFIMHFTEMSQNVEHKSTIFPGIEILHK